MDFSKNFSDRSQSFTAGLHDISAGERHLDVEASLYIPSGPSNLCEGKGDTYGIDAIENAIAIFGKEKVRAWTGGIPQVFGDCSEANVKDLFYPDFVEWNKTRLEK